MPTRYGRSPWIDRFPKSRVPSYPRYRGAAAADVAIVGGGLTGCIAAYAFRSTGLKVVLLEAETIGGSSTGSAAGWISEDPGVPFVHVEKTLGLRAARHAFEAWRRSALDFIALLRRLDIKCSLEPRTAVTIAGAPEQASRLTREQKARKEAGLETPVLSARAVHGELAVASTGIRSRDGATLDPYRACLGLAAAASERGAIIFEHSPVQKITFTRRIADVHTEGGSIRASRVVIATGRPTALFKSLARHFWLRTAYLALTEPVPARIRRQLGTRASVLRDFADPPHIVRWMDDDRLLITGADTDSPPDQRRDKMIVQRTGQLMYELSTVYPDISGILPDYGWHAEYAKTAEGLPYIGPHRNFPHHLFVFGDSSHSLTGAYLASRILLRHHSEEVAAADQVFAFTR